MSRKRNADRYLGLAAVTGMALAAVGSLTVEAHKAVTSPYTYNEHVFPILRDRCGRCHTDGGVAPMSLLVYRGKDGGGAFAWAQSMREMLVAGAMPPWYIDATGPAVKNPHTLTARELDTLITWASGGTPEGDPARKPATTVTQAGWMLGEPDLVIPMPEEHRVPANTLEETVDLLLPTHLTETRWVKAVDLRAGAPTLVRRAVIRVENGPVLAVWEPGDDPIPAPSGTAFRIPAAAKLRVQLFYKKPWQAEGQERVDRSSVGLYLTDEPLSGRSIDTFAIDAPKQEGHLPRHFGGTLPMAGRILAVRPQLDRAYESVEATAVAPSGKRVPLLRLYAAWPEWPRRYWLADPVELPTGTKIEVTGMPGDPDRGPLTKVATTPLEVAFDFVLIGS